MLQLASTLVLLGLPMAAMAQLASMRATIPGSLHQCEDTNIFFFDTDDSRPLTVLFLPSSEVPDSLRSGTITLDDAAAYSPLQVIQNYTTADAAAYEFTLGIAEGEVFEMFGFLEDGSGKALSLTRTVTTPLPSATSCLGDTQTTVSGVAAAAATTTSSSSSTSRASSSASSSSSKSSSGSSSSGTRTTSTATMTATATSSDTSSSAGANAAAAATSQMTGAAGINKAVVGFVGLAAAVGALTVF